MQSWVGMAIWTAARWSARKRSMWGVFGLRYPRPILERISRDTAHAVRAIAGWACFGLAGKKEPAKLLLPGKEVLDRRFKFPRNATSNNET